MSICLFIKLLWKSPNFMLKSKHYVENSIQLNSNQIRRKQLSVNQRQKQLKNSQSKQLEHQKDLKR